MSRLDIKAPADARITLEHLYEDFIRRIQSSPTAVCPVDMVSSFIKMCQSQSCGKCVPCRVGLQSLAGLIESVLDGRAKPGALRLIESTARVVSDTADCAIGYGAADMVLKSIVSFKEDYESHIKRDKCTARFEQGIPCVSGCPAGVDVPGYLTLVGERRYDDAIRLIRRDNPFPAACGYVCEHPCENQCRRGLLDDAVNIRGIKRFAADNAGKVSPLANHAPTGKKVAVVGGGPAGLACAYFLRLRGHNVTIYEKQPELGGMLRYGIPGFRLPADKLKYDLDNIIATGVNVKLGTEIGRDVNFNDLRKTYDAVYIAIGAHADKKLQIEGSDKKGVISAVDLLRAVGSGEKPDLTGKNVLIVGGGNVALDSARAAKRLGAASAGIVYRRRIKDMPAYSSDITAALSEGVTIHELCAPAAIESDSTGNVTALNVRPQIVGAIGSDRRVSTRDAKTDELALPCDTVIVAIGQDVENRHFSECVVPVEWGVLQTDKDGAVPTMPGVFAGGDCTSGPASVVHAIAAGKDAAAKIDNHLGFDNKIKVDIKFSFAPLREKPLVGRAETSKLVGCNCGFESAESGLSREEVAQEAMRCLRCDRFGFGALGEV